VGRKNKNAHDKPRGKRSYKTPKGANGRHTNRSTGDNHRYVEKAITDERK